MALLADGLLPASFRGVPFAVQASDAGIGRRIALHQYPGRDDPWAEDIGRQARRWRFRGFIVDSDVVFAGGPIQLQRTLLIAAFEAKGSGLLTHPTLASSRPASRPRRSARISAPAAGRASKSPSSRAASRGSSRSNRSAPPSAARRP